MAQDCRCQFLLRLRQGKSNLPAAFPLGEKVAGSQDVRHDLALVVGRAACIDAAVANGRVEGRGCPFRQWLRRLHIVVAVDKNRWLGRVVWRPRDSLKGGRRSGRRPPENRDPETCVLAIPHMRSCPPHARIELRRWGNAETPTGYSPQTHSYHFNRLRSCDLQPQYVVFFLAIASRLAHKRRPKGG